MDPPGLEVVHAEALSTPIISTTDPGNRNDEIGIEPNPTDSANAAKTNQVLHRQIRICWLIVAIAALVALAIILGALLSIKHHPSSPTSTVTTTISEPTSTPTAIRHNSGLAVTGWRNGSYFSIRLFYQGQDSYLRISQFESMTGKWSTPSPFVVAKPGSPVAASAFNGNSFWGGGDSVCLIFPKCKIWRLIIVD
jgi:hypothetical protein